MFLHAYVLCGYTTIRVSINNSYNDFIGEALQTLIQKNIPDNSSKEHHCYSYVNKTMGKTKELSVELRQNY